MQYRIAPTCPTDRRSSGHAPSALPVVPALSASNSSSRLMRAGHELRVLTRASSHGIDLRPLPSVELASATSTPGFPAPQHRRLRRRHQPGRHPQRARLRRRRISPCARGIHRGLLRAMAQLRVPRLLQMSALNADAERGRSHYLRSKGAGRETDTRRPRGARLDHLPAVGDLRAGRLTDQSLRRTAAPHRRRAAAGARRCALRADLRRRCRRGLHPGAARRRHQPPGATSCAGRRC
jgi:hypothetical protein